MAPKSADSQAPQRTLDVTWEDYEYLVRSLAEQVKKSGRSFNHVHGLARGGLVPAVHLSHILGIPFSPTKIGLDPRTTLLVDDVSDTGQTLVPYKKNGFVIATLHVKPGTRVMSHYFVDSVDREVWINYPWEE